MFMAKCQQIWIYKCNSLIFASEKCNFLGKSKIKADGTADLLTKKKWLCVVFLFVFLIYSPFPHGNSIMIIKRERQTLMYFTIMN